MPEARRDGPVRPYRWLFDGVLARVEPERAHHLGMASIRAAAPLTRRAGTLPGRRPVAEVPALGLTFPHVLGLAAGFDKNAVAIDALGALGFGHVEVGTVTAEPQPGNPRPRLFRLPADRALVNRMGFNNDGAEAVARRLADRARRHRGSRDTAPDVVVGVNIGKSRVVSEHDPEAVSRDYERSAALVAPYADYLVVNVSSPNTPGLRDLQAVERLEPILRVVRRTADQAAEERRRRVPLLVKIAPDLDDDDVVAVADLALAVGLDGVVATNTTVSRAGLATDRQRCAEIGDGGLSGPPLAQRSLAVLRLLATRAAGRLVLVSVGGIASVADARARLDAGATLLQAYTAFVYEGPLWPRRLVRGLEARP